MNNLSNINSIKIENITKFFGSNKILENINFEFEKNKSYLIKGQSGAGKSTLINILSGLEPQTSGSVYYNNINISKINNKSKIFQNSIGLIFQNPHLIKELTVLENIIIKSLISGKNKKELQPLALNLLDKLNLKDKYLNYPSSLSSGQQQRVALARALFNNPDFLIADEPTANLDEKNKNLILNLIFEFQKDLKMGLIIISHDELISKRMQNQIEIKNNKIYY